MTNTDFPDEILMRFADGELDPDTSAKLERAMETDDELVARVALFIETRAEAQAALKPLLDEPVPEHLVAAVERMVEEKRAKESPVATIVPFRKPAQERSPVRQWALPLAASVAAVLGGLAGYWAAGSGVDSLQVAGVSSPALRDALETVASGDEIQLPGSNQRFRVIATFRDSARALCREFEVDSPDRSTVISVACHSGDDWRVSFAVVAPGDSTGYAPASSTDALDAYLSAIHAEAPMPVEEEAQALGEVRRRSGN